MTHDQPTLACGCTLPCHPDVAFGSNESAIRAMKAQFDCRERRRKLHCCA